MGGGGAQLHCMSGGQTHSAFPREGKSALQIGTRLSGVSLLMQAREVPEEEWTTFELMYRLQGLGWRSSVFERVRRRKKERGPRPLEPQDFVQGGVRTYWFKAGQTTLPRSYLLALHRASMGTLIEPVRHMQPVAYYDALLVGQVYARRERGFKFHGASDQVFHPKRRLRQGGGRRVVRKRAVAQDAHGESEEETPLSMPFVHQLGSERCALLGFAPRMFGDVYVDNSMLLWIAGGMFLTYPGAVAGHPCANR